jgi:VanZ family protein
MHFGRDRSVLAIAKALEEAAGLGPFQSPGRKAGIHLRVPWLVLACVATLIVFVLTDLPEGIVPADLGMHAGDKLSHAIGYGLLTWCWFGAVRGFRRLSYLLVIPLMVMAVGAIDEVTQPLA